jgi:drug/metabolite transporter (DMT)-like permease
MFRLYALLGACVMIWVALGEVLSGAIGDWYIGIPLAGAVTFAAAYFANKSITKHDYDKEYLCAAFLCVVLGFLLMLAEGLLSLELDFEDPLMAYGALCAIAEEVRLVQKRNPGA